MPSATSDSEDAAETAGEEVPLRAARKSLLLMLLAVLAGRPRLIAVQREGVAS